jgi:septal ring factor EnvC (AmiA/AmiB activator)
MYPDDPDSNSLLDIAFDVRVRSSEQLERTKNHSQPIIQAKIQLESQKQSVSDLKDSLNSTGNKDNQINVKLRELQSDSRKCKFINYKLQLNIESIE